MSDANSASLDELIRRAQSGDEDSWAQLVEQHTAGLRRRIRSRLSPPVRRRISDSDVVQETWMVANRRLQDFESQGPGSFQAWLGAIAEHTARGFVKRHARAAKRDARTEVTRGARVETAHFAGRRPTASAEAMGRELRGRIGEAMAVLPKDYRTIIELLQHRRVTIAEAAELMGRTPNAIKKLHGRALGELAEILGVQGRKSHGTD